MSGTKKGTDRDSPIVGHGSKFSRKKEAAIEALLTHRNVEEAARAVGIGKQTLLRWMKMPEFQADYQEACRNAVSQTNGRLQGASGAAASTLLKIMVDGNAPASARVRAAESVLDRANRAIDSEEVQARLAALEQTAKSRKPSELTE
jgi:transposase-like protein